MSFIIRVRATGESKVECARDTQSSLRGYLESVPALQHLQELNDPKTLAYAWARRAPEPK